jgi:hypothetical protein
MVTIQIGKFYVCPIELANTAPVRLNARMIRTFFIAFAFAQLSSSPAASAPRCAAPAPNEPRLKQSDFHWNMTPAEIKAKAEEIYAGGKRLPARAHFDRQKNAFVFSRNGMQVRLPGRLIKSVTRHIEEALRLDYVDAVIFPDMGHSHFLIPSVYYDKEIASLAADDPGTLTKIFEYPETRVLYHTGEQVKFKEGEDLLPDPKLRWRYYVRNLAGDNGDDPKLEIHFAAGEKFNTVRDVPGYFYWGAGFNISASRDGCFPYRHNGQTYYFDMSLEDLPSDSGG